MTNKQYDIKDIGLAEQWPQTHGMGLKTKCPCCARFASGFQEREAVQRHARLGSALPRDCRNGQLDGNAGWVVPMWYLPR
jgi:hypothetical protein